MTDALWFASLSLDTSPEDVAQIFSRKQDWGLHWSWESCDSAKLQMILDKTCTMGSCIAVSKDECIPMLMGVGHNNRLTYIISVVEPSDIPLADVEFCPPSHGDPSPNHDTTTSTAVVRNPGWRLVTLPNSTPNPLSTIMKIKTLPSL